jgi:sugar lactone lactonase YvrE
MLGAMADEPRLLLDGLRFAEGPRWHDGRLWFSDMHDGEVRAVDLDGRVETIVAVPQEPSGLGWLPDGRLLVVSMKDRRVLRLERGALVEHADLSPFATWHCNDMVVDGRGRAYVGNFGFDLHAREPRPPPTPADVVLVHPDGRAEVAAEGLLFPNGTVITPDARTLIVGESFGARLTAFDVAGDGRLSNRRVWAQLAGGAVPDGICLDAEGAVWVASPTTNEFLRLREGGAVAARIAVDRSAIACMLGGPARRTLFLCTSRAHDPADTAGREARIAVVEVDVPGAGWP